MRIVHFLIMIFFAVSFLNASQKELSLKQINKIAEKIWRNECGGKRGHLTHWNQGEEFASFGIGHFIWYSKGKKGRFEETFPQLLLFLEERGVSLPRWLRKTKGSPWRSREEFYQKFHSEKMNQLRHLLFDTKHLQALFIANRLETLLSTLQEKKEVLDAFHALAADPRGFYALMDYLNFKGEGASSAERYKGSGWGLVQVLESMASSSKATVEEFVAAAKALLLKRVENAPPERKEERWLKGWFNRLDTYLEFP